MLPYLELCLHLLHEATLFIPDLCRRFPILNISAANISAIGDFRQDFAAFAFVRDDDRVDSIMFLMPSAAATIHATGRARARWSMDGELSLTSDNVAAGYPSEVFSADRIDELRVRGRIMFTGHAPMPVR
ncbi:hypothetical protein [Rhizobium leguminosarum]|uniref:hypothetical protein n=1 Tax=Rhizobium leguminosarum TaxID=384 RepID=UPI001C969996|nr:hypothetical protein [Rhizobium leguminosarum]